MITFGMTIDGQDVAAKSRFAVLNPATGRVIGEAPNADLDDLDRAVQAAKAAFPAWAARPDAERQAICETLAKAIGQHADEIAVTLTLEQGKPLNGIGSRFELGGAQAWASHTASLSLPMKVLQDDNERRIELHRKPIGVVGSITPWNWPVMIAIWHIIPALRVGNTVVIKPSPYTPLSTLQTVRILSRLLPAGVLNIVTGGDSAGNLGAALSAHPDIGKIVFTGSTVTGVRVMQSAAPTMKRLTLELGGNDAGIVLPDCNPEEIAEKLFWSALINNGQTCAAMKRLYVHDSIHDAVCDALVRVAGQVRMGDGMEADSQLGPVANQMQFDKVAALAEDAARSGRVLTGGTAREGLFFPATFISDLPADAPLIHEEQFGPVLPIIRFTDIDEAVAAANASENGLGGSVWSRDIPRAKEIALRLECGSAWINQHGAIQPNAPFGGVKRSGIGVEFGEEGLAENTNLQTLHIC